MTLNLVCKMCGMKFSTTLEYNVHKQKEFEENRKTRQQEISRRLQLKMEQEKRLQKFFEDSFMKNKNKTIIQDESNLFAEDPIMKARRRYVEVENYNNPEQISSFFIKIIIFLQNQYKNNGIKSRLAYGEEDTLIILNGKVKENPKNLFNLQIDKEYKEEMNEGDEI